MKIEGRMHRETAGNLVSLDELVDHFRQRRVGQAVTVVGEENFLMLNQMSDRHQTLADIRPNARINKGNFQVRRLLAQNFNLLAVIRNDAVAVGPPVRVQKVVLDDVSLVTEAQHKIAMSVLAVVIHDVSKDRLMTNGDHWLWYGLGILSDASPETAAKQNNLHRLELFFRLLLAKSNIKLARSEQKHKLFWIFSADLPLNVHPAAIRVSVILRRMAQGEQRPAPVRHREALLSRR